MSRWEIAANISGGRGHREYGGRFIMTNIDGYGSFHPGFYRSGWDAGPYGWGGYGGRYGGGIRFNVRIGNIGDVRIGNIGDFFRDLFHREPPAANGPGYANLPPVADGYQVGGTLDGSAWQPYDPRTRLDAGGGTDAYIIGAHPLTPRERTNQSMFRSLAIDTTAPRDLTSLRAANDPSWDARVYGDYMGIPGMHIGNS